MGKTLAAVKLDPLKTDGVSARALGNARVLALGITDVLIVGFTERVLSF